jgi:hypothetical protein
MKKQDDTESTGYSFEDVIDLIGGLITSVIPKDALPSGKSGFAEESEGEGEEYDFTKTIVLDNSKSTANRIENSFCRIVISQDPETKNPTHEILGYPKDLLNCEKLQIIEFAKVKIITSVNVQDAKFVLKLKTKERISIKNRKHHLHEKKYHIKDGKENTSQYSQHFGGSNENVLLNLKCYFKDHQNSHILPTSLFGMEKCVQSLLKPIKTIKGFKDANIKELRRQPMSITIDEKHIIINHGNKVFHKDSWIRKQIEENQYSIKLVIDDFAIYPLYNNSDYMIMEEKCYKFVYELLKEKMCKLRYVCEKAIEVGVEENIVCKKKEEDYSIEIIMDIIVWEIDDRVNISDCVYNI